MNVPQCALNSILRDNGYTEVEPGSICIDEKMLSVFADAYIRKMKNYFLSSVRNIENLSYQEFTDLDEFYNTFKKQDVKFVRRAEWSQIDTELIRTAFMDKIKELTPRKKSRFELFLEQVYGRFESYSVCHELAHVLIKESCSDEESRLLDRVTHLCSDENKQASVLQQDHENRNGCKSTIDDARSSQHSNQIDR